MKLMINSFKCKSFKTIVLIRYFTKEKKLFREIINIILGQFLAKHFDMQLLHLQTFTDSPWYNIFSQKRTTYFSLFVDEDRIIEHAFIFSIRYCVYVLMEQFMSVVVDMEVVDKRETK